jgi:hypothetical protein
MLQTFFGLPPGDVLPLSRDDNESILWTRYGTRRLLRHQTLLETLYAIRSERMLMQPIGYMLFRWVIGLPLDDAVRAHSRFSKNRDRLLKHVVIVGLFNETVEVEKVRQSSTSARTIR